MRIEIYRKSARVSVLIDYYLITMMILCSGTAIFNIKYNSIIIPLFAVSSVILSILKSRKNWIEPEIVVLLGIYVVNLIIHLIDGVAVNGIIQISLYSIGTYATLRLLSFEEYKRYYVNIVVALCVLAILVFFGVNNGIINSSYEYINGQGYQVAFLHVVGWEWVVFSTRMCGLFHEPGMFQIVINIGLIYLTDGFLQNKRKKGDIAKAVIFIFAILQTRSTAGYIMMSFVLGVLYLRYWRSVQGFKKLIYALFLPLVVMGGYHIARSEVILNKLTHNNISYRIRTNDTFSGIQMIIKKPILGYGYNSVLYDEESRLYGMDGISNGIIGITIMFGIPVMAILLFYMIRSTLRDRWGVPPFIVVLFFVLEQMTEASLLFPISLAFILPFKNSIQERIKYHSGIRDCNYRNNPVNQQVN